MTVELRVRWNIIWVVKPQEPKEPHLSFIVSGVEETRPGFTASRRTQQWSLLFQELKNHLRILLSQNTNEAADDCIIVSAIERISFQVLSRTEGISRALLHCFCKRKALVLGFTVSRTEGTHVLGLLLEEMKEPFPHDVTFGVVVQSSPWFTISESVLGFAV